MSCLRAASASHNIEILIIASGSTCQWKGPVDFPLREIDVLPHIHSWRSKFATAKHVVIVGGGPLGVELAGQESDYISFNSGFSTAPTRFLFATRLLVRGADLFFNEYADTIPEQGTVGLVTRKGTVTPDAYLVVRVSRLFALHTAQLAL
ncbi:hypothetical protein V8E55_000309 [Tylopilus felleus]